MKLFVFLLLFPAWLMAQAPLPDPPSPPTTSPTVFYKTMEVTYIGLNAIDLGLTLYALDNGAQEVNPLFKNASPATMIATKVVFTGGVLWLNRIAYKNNPKAAKIKIVGMNELMGLVVTNNATVTINLNR